jgi:hypothetical protein
MTPKHLLISCFLIPLVFLGCASTLPGPGGVFPGGLFGSTVIPGDLAELDQRYSAYPDSFEILGVVEGTSSATNILGIFSFGNGGYLNALDNALNPIGADGIINCSSDISSTSFLVLFATSKTHIRGIAIKLKQPGSTPH